MKMPKSIKFGPYGKEYFQRLLRVNSPHASRPQSHADPLRCHPHLHRHTPLNNQPPRVPSSSTTMGSVLTRLCRTRLRSCRDITWPCTDLSPTTQSSRNSHSALLHRNLPWKHLSIRPPHRCLRTQRRPRSRNQIAIPATARSLGVVVNNSNAKRKLQAILELHQENNLREQISHNHRNLDRGSWNEVPEGWQSIGDERADGDDHCHYVGHFRNYSEDDLRYFS